MNNQLADIQLAKVRKYSFLVASSLAILPSCSEDEEEISSIDYINIQPDAILTPFPTITTDQSAVLDLIHLIDFNDDGIDEISLRIVNYNRQYDYYSGHFYDYLNQRTSTVTAINGAQVLTRTEAFDSVGDGIVAKGLELGEPINASQNIWGETGDLGLDQIYEDSTTIQFGDFLGTEKFLGVQFEVAGQKHYGWVRISVTADSRSLRIMDYAYHLAPNTSIEAGEK
jgi:hypothetical protein